MISLNVPPKCKSWLTAYQGAALPSALCVRGSTKYSAGEQEPGFRPPPPTPRLCSRHHRVPWAQALSRPHTSISGQVLWFQYSPPLPLHWGHHLSPSQAHRPSHLDSAAGVPRSPCFSVQMLSSNWIIPPLRRVSGDPPAPGSHLRSLPATPRSTRVTEASPAPSHCLASCCVAVQLGPTLRDPMGHSPGSFVHGLSQARILEWLAISFTRGSSPPRDGAHGSCWSERFFTTEPPGKPLATRWLPGAQQCPGCFPLWPRGLHGAPSPPTGSLTLLTHFCSPAQPQTQTLTSGHSNIALLWTFKIMSHALTTLQVLLTLSSTIQNLYVHFLPRFLNNEVPEGNDFSHVTGTQGLWQEPNIPLHKSKKTVALPPKL